MAPPSAQMIVWDDLGKQQISLKRILRMVEPLSIVFCTSVANSPRLTVASPEGKNENKNEGSLRKIKLNDGNLRKNEESETLAHPGL